MDLLRVDFWVTAFKDNHETKKVLNSGSQLINWVKILLKRTCPKVAPCHGRLFYLVIETLATKVKNNDDIFMLGSSFSCVQWECKWETILTSSCTPLSLNAWTPRGTALAK